MGKDRSATNSYPSKYVVTKRVLGERPPGYLLCIGASEGVLDEVTMKPDPDKGAEASPVTRGDESVQAEGYMQGDREARVTLALERLTGGREQEQKLIRHKGSSGRWRSRQGRDMRDLEGCTKGALSSPKGLLGATVIPEPPSHDRSLGYGLILESWLFDDFHKTLFPV